MGVYGTGNVHIIWCCGQLAPSYILEVLLQCNIVRHKSQEITVGSYPDAFSIVQPPTLPMLMPGRPLFRAMAARQPLPRVAEVVDNGSNAANLRRQGLGAALYSTFSPGTASSVNNGQVRNAAAAGRGGGYSTCERSSNTCPESSPHSNTAAVRMLVPTYCCSTRYGIR